MAHAKIDFRAERTRQDRRTIAEVMDWPGRNQTGRNWWTLVDTGGREIRNAGQVWTEREWIELDGVIDDVPADMDGCRMGLTDWLHCQIFLLMGRCCPHACWMSLPIGSTGGIYLKEQIYIILTAAVHQAGRQWTVHI